MTPDIALLTVCDDPGHPGLARLRRSCDRWGWRLHVEYIRPWGGVWSKVVGVRHRLPSLRQKGVTHLIASDGYDVVVNGPPEDAAAFAGPGALFSAEAWCWPMPELAPLYPPHPGRWRFLNSGGYLGEVGYLADVLLRGGPLTPEQTGGRDGLRLEDQSWFTWKYLADPGRIRLDHDCRVFQTLGSGVVDDAHPWWETFEWVGGRVRNKVTGSLPLLLHGNGGGDLSWLEEG